MRRQCTAAATLAATFIISSAAPAPAQSTGLLSPADFRRWDVSAHVGWFGHRPDVPRREWDDWYHSPEAGGFAGYHLTPHLKLEAGASATSEGHIYAAEPVAVPGQPFPIFRSQRHFIRTTSLTTGVAYQFAENAWFHPFLSAGIEITGESRRTVAEPHFVAGDGPRAPVVAVPGETARRTRLSPRPYVAGGFKWYVTERAFIRADVQGTVASAAGRTIVWRSGIGFDF